MRLNPFHFGRGVHRVDYAGSHGSSDRNATERMQILHYVKRFYVIFSTLGIHHRTLILTVKQPLVCRSSQPIHVGFFRRTVGA